MNFKNKIHAFTLLCVFATGECFSTPMIRQAVIKNTVEITDIDGKKYIFELDCRENPCTVTAMANNKILHSFKILYNESIDPYYFSVYGDIKFNEKYYYMEVAISSCEEFEECLIGFIVENGVASTKKENFEYISLEKNNCGQEKKCGKNLKY